MTTQTKPRTRTRARFDDELDKQTWHWDTAENSEEPAPPTRRVLVVEDDPRIASLLERALRREGYTVDIAENGTDALTCGLESQYSVILMDLMIPAPDGLTVVRCLREAGQWAPVLMLTARDGVQDRVEGLHAGADDYLTKPFAIVEVLARVFALARRELGAPDPLQVGDLIVDRATRTVHRGLVPIPLAHRDFCLLVELMRHPGQAVNRSYLRAHVLAGRPGLDDTDLGLHVARLRARVDEPFGRRSIESVGLDGYRVVDDR